MNNSLMARLRHWQQYGPYRPSRYKEAADRIENLESEVLQCFHRIEKLQAALRVIVQVWDTDQPISIARAALARDAARKALEGEDDPQTYL